MINAKGLTVLRNLLKKLTVGLLPAVMLFAMLAGTAVKVSANLPIVYEWAGRDNLSFKMLDGDFSKFLKLTCDDEEVDPINYTVSAENGNILTLKEEYLKTLANGTYSFTCYSSGEGVEIPMYGEIVDSPGPPYGIEHICALYTDAYHLCGRKYGSFLLYCNKGQRL